MWYSEVRYVLVMRLVSRGRPASVEAPLCVWLGIAQKFVYTRTVFFRLPWDGHKVSSSELISLDIALLVLTDAYIYINSFTFLF